MKTILQRYDSRENFPNTHIQEKLFFNLKRETNIILFLFYIVTIVIFTQKRKCPQDETIQKLPFYFSVGCFKST